MKLKGVTRADMSSDLEIKYTTLNDWVHGLKFPRYDKVEMLADYFGITIEELLSEEGHKLAYYSNLVKSGMEKRDYVIRTSDGLEFLLETRSKLNDEGKKMLDEYAQFLLSKYEKGE